MRGSRVGSDDVGRIRGLFVDGMEPSHSGSRRPLLWLVRTHCGLEKFCGLLRVLK